MDSTATRRSSRLNQVTRIRSVALNNAMSDSKRRVFSITVSDGKTKFFTAAVPDHASTHTIDDLFNMMRWTVSPLNDLKINTDELAALQRSYLQITGLHETQRPQVCADSCAASGKEPSADIYSNSFPRYPNPSARLTTTSGVPPRFLCRG